MKLPSQARWRPHDNRSWCKEHAEEKTESVDQNQNRKETLRYFSHLSSPGVCCGFWPHQTTWRPHGAGRGRVWCRPIRRRSGISVDADQRGFSRSWSPVSRTLSMEASGGAERPDCPLTPRGSLLDADRGTISHSDLFLMVGDGRVKHIWTNYRGKTPGCITILYFYPTKSTIWDTHGAFMDAVFYWSLLCFFINTDLLQKGCTTLLAGI